MLLQKKEVKGSVVERSEWLLREREQEDRYSRECVKMGGERESLITER